MTISLTCACGAHLEVDDTFAGQTINCPDCQRPIATPRPERVGLQTSGLALASLTLALVGAFTLFGTLLAILLGALALRAMARHPDRLTGKGYAVAGIGLGVFFTGLTAFALSSVEVFHNVLGRLQWAGKLDYAGGDEVIRKTEGFAIKRPSPRWGVKRSDRPEDAHIWDDLVMVNVDEDAHLVCIAQQLAGETTLDQCRHQAQAEFREQDKAGIFGKPGFLRRGVVEVLETRHPPPVQNMDMVEILLDKRLAGQERRFVMRVIKDRASNTAFVLIGGARKSNFARIEPEIRKAMESFRLLDGGAGNFR